MTSFADYAKQAQAFANGEAPGQAPANNGKSDRKPAVAWMNHGMLMPVTQDDGSKKEEFITSFGVPFTSLTEWKQETASTNSSNHWRMVAEAKNFQRSFIMAQLQEMKPGETRVFGTAPFQIELRVVGAAEAPSSAPGENELVSSMADMFEKAVKPQAA